MKYLKQFMIIIIISFFGEVLNRLLPFPVPASVYGMVLMFLCLYTGIVKLWQVEKAAGFFIKIMPVLFVPAAASLITAVGILSDYMIEVIVIILVSTLIVMAVTGKIAQFIIERDK
jgi:holin-like protein